MWSTDGRTTDGRTYVPTVAFFEGGIKIQKHNKNSFFSECIIRVLWCSLCVCFCTSHVVMVPLNLTCLHCFQHSFFEHSFNLYLDSWLERRCFFLLKSIEESSKKNCCKKWGHVIYLWHLMWNKFISTDYQ